MVKKMVDVEKDVLSLCICKKCTSFVDCKEKIGFCFINIGKSKCIKEERGCICMGCPTTKKYNLQRGYYCTRGPEKKWDLK